MISPLLTNRKKTRKKKIMSKKLCDTTLKKCFRAPNSVNPETVIAQNVIDRVTKEAFTIQHQELPENVIGIPKIDKATGERYIEIYEEPVLLTDYLVIRVPTDSDSAVVQVVKSDFETIIHNPGNPFPDANYSLNPAYTLQQKTAPCVADNTYYTSPVGSGGAGDTIYKIDWITGNTIASVDVSSNSLGSESISRIIVAPTGEVIVFCALDSGFKKNIVIYSNDLSEVLFISRVSTDAGLFNEDGGNFTNVQYMAVIKGSFVIATNSAVWFVDLATYAVTRHFTYSAVKESQEASFGYAAGKNGAYLYAYDFNATDGKDSLYLLEEDGTTTQSEIPHSGSAGYSFSGSIKAGPDEEIYAFTADAGDLVRYNPETQTITLVALRSALPATIEDFVVNNEGYVFVRSGGTNDSAIVNPKGAVTLLSPDTNSDLRSVYPLPNPVWVTHES